MEKILSKTNKFWKLCIPIITLILAGFAVSVVSNNFEELNDKIESNYQNKQKKICHLYGGFLNMHVFNLGTLTHFDFKAKILSKVLEQEGTKHTVFTGNAKLKISYSAPEKIFFIDVDEQNITKHSVKANGKLINSSFDYYNDYVPRKVLCFNGVDQANVVYEIDLDFRGCDHFTVCTPQKTICKIIIEGNGNIVVDGLDHYVEKNINGNNFSLEWRGIQPNSLKTISFATSKNKYKDFYHTEKLIKYLPFMFLLLFAIIWIGKKATRTTIFPLQYFGIIAAGIPFYPALIIMNLYIPLSAAYTISASLTVAALTACLRYLFGSWVPAVISAIFIAASYAAIYIMTVNTNMIHWITAAALLAVIIPVVFLSLSDHTASNDSND